MFSLIIAAFITGLTAGGLSCFAVQGGLLSGSIAHQVDGPGFYGSATRYRRAGVVNIPPQAPGTTMKFMFTMGMYGGVMQFQ